MFKGKSFFRKLFYIVDINNHSKTSVSFSLYLIQHNKAESYIKNSCNLGRRCGRGGAEGGGGDDQLKKLAASEMI